MPLTAIQSLWRRWARLPPIAAVRRRRRVERARRALRYGMSVRESVRFAVRELRRAAGVHVYHLREGGWTVALRHNEHDGWVLHEVFGTRAYEMPTEVDGALRSSPHPLRVVDLGGHLGLFGLFILSRHPDALITAFEPDPEQASILRGTIARNGRSDRWRLHEAAACPHEGQVRFAGGLGERSHVAAADEPTGLVVRAADLFRHIEAPDLLKIDIEGGEWALLRDERFALAGVRSVALEYHARDCPEADPRAAATRLLEQMGYAVCHRPNGTLSADVGLLWAWRRDGDGDRSSPGVRPT